MGTCCIAQGAQLGLCGDLDGWDGEVGRREFQEGGDICINIADSLRCTAETNTTEKSNYIPI